MFSPNLRYFNPDARSQLEALELHQLTRDFYQEAQYREALEQYCQWYYAIAEQNRRDLKQMQKEVNLFGWFCRLMWRN